MVGAATDETTWHKGNSEEKTQPVGKKAPSPWGLYDMLGNVGEWTVAPDGKGRMCGGSYQMALDELVPSLTLKQVPDWNKRDPQMPKSRWWLSDGPFAGFRIVCDAFPDSPPASEGAPK
jgi:formylglycine-generating enzyme required for sulfatase activity